MRFFRLIAIIFLAVCGILCLTLLEIFGSGTRSIEAAAPADARWVLKIDAASLLKEEAYTVLFESKDEELLRAIQKLAETKLDQTDDDKPLYINLFSEMVVFGIEKNNHTFTGLLFELDNVRLFEKNIQTYLKPGQTFAVKDKTALILLKTDKRRFDAKAQGKLTAELLSGRNKHYLRKTPRANNEWITLEGKNFGWACRSVDVGLFFDKNVISMRGEFVANRDLVLPKYSLNAKGLFISSSFVNKSLVDTIAKYTQGDKFSIPELHSVTIDYRGMSVENTNDGILQLPQINAIFHSKTPLSVAQIRSYASEKYRLGSNALRFSETTYYLKQLDKTTVFFGLDTTAIVYQPQTSMFTVKGKLMPLVTVQAEPMILMGMNVMLPQIGNLRKFIESTESVDLKLISKGNKSYTVDGKFLFKPNAAPMGEMTKLVLGLNLLK